MCRFVGAAAPFAASSSAHTPPKTAGGYLGGLRSAGRLILALLGFFSIGQLECADSEFGKLGLPVTA